MSSRSSIFLKSVRPRSKTRLALNEKSRLLMNPTTCRSHRARTHRANVHKYEHTHAHIWRFGGDYGSRARGCRLFGRAPFVATSVCVSRRGCYRNKSYWASRLIGGAPTTIPIPSQPYPPRRAHRAVSMSKTICIYIYIHIQCIHENARDEGVPHRIPYIHLSRTSNCVSNKWLVHTVCVCVYECVN